MKANMSAMYDSLINSYRIIRAKDLHLKAYRKDNVIATSRVNVFADTTVKPDLVCFISIISI